MKILITGGNGYISRNITPKLIAMGHNVQAPSRTELNLLDQEDLNTLYYKFRPDVIIHGAIIGGNRDITDTFDSTYVSNITMFENICNIINPSVKVIIIGSGAEFDRRRDIWYANEYDIFDRYPIDPYGLSKNIITRRSVNDYKNIFILRLFGCFNEDEENTRFIKRSILNVKNNLPIDIHQNRYMDFFYLDDLVTILEHVMTNTVWKDINLVYEHKYTLLDIATIISEYMSKYNPKINIINELQGKSYTGASDLLYRELHSKNMTNKLIGLREGINRTINNLL